MMNIPEILIKDFNYVLPPNKIALYPLPRRDSSKLLVYKSGNIAIHTYADMADCLPANSLMVFNDTRVMAVRLLFTKHTGSTIELFCLEPADEYADVTTAMLQQGSVRWKCLVGGAKKWKTERLSSSRQMDGGEVVLTVEKEAQQGDHFLVAFTWSRPELTFAEVLSLFGSMPLPPYLNRPAGPADEDRYQTVYARYNGSVAAPTAGLHFTKELLGKLADKGLKQDFVTLHVGAGTFKPVKADTIAGHDMHAEWIEVRQSLVENLLQYATNTIVAVGTTSLRTIESVYWMGVKILLQPEASRDELFIGQWEAYQLPQHIPAAEALGALLQWMQKNKQPVLVSKTKILIAPGYRLRIARALVTNFHQPQSTLLLLIAAIVGKRWKDIYEFALDNDFRFLSYGDGSLLWYEEAQY